MRICPKCRNTVADDVQSCPDDGLRTVTREVLEASANDPLVGTTLAERYTITGRLGAGGMGTVYRSEQAPLGREVALKVLRKELGRDPDTVLRFTREAKLLSQLRHPNTVTILDFGQSPEGLLYLAMELLEGEMLSSRMRAVGALDVELAARVACGVLRSLDEAHARGIIHRDLKPDNIFLAKVHGRPDDDEVVKVVDFGIAKIRDGELTPGLDPVATQEGTVFGTPRYMSPEQAQGKSLDGRSDLYAVGVLLFHMLTGNPPFTDDDAVIVMAHHIKTVPPPVRRQVPDRGIPASLEELVIRALAKSPDDRPQSAEEFLSDLEALGPDIQAARARSLLLTEETAIIAISPTPRRTWVGVAAAAAAALVATLVGFSLLNRHPAQDPTQERAHAGRGQQSLVLAAPTAPEPAAPVAPPPAVAEPAPGVPPEPPVADMVMAPSSDPSDVGPADASGDLAERRRHHHHASQVAEAPPPTAPTTPPAARGHVRRPNQPYQTFEGM